MKTKTALILFIFIFILSGFVIADETPYYGIYQVNQEINLIQTCSNCTFVNITSIVNPNADIILTESAMTKTGSTYNYTLSAQSLTGRYQVCGIADPYGFYDTWCFTFDLTWTGKEPGNNLLSIILLYVIIIIFYVILGYFNYKDNNLNVGNFNYWISFTCYALAIITLIIAIFTVRLYEMSGNVNLLLYVVWIINLIILFFAGMLTLYRHIFAMVDFTSFEDQKWGKKKGKW